MRQTLYTIQHTQNFNRPAFIYARALGMIDLSYYYFIIVLLLLLLLSLSLLLLFILLLLLSLLLLLLLLLLLSLRLLLLFYKELNGRNKDENISPDRDKFTTFWSNIWSVPSTHNDEARSQGEQKGCRRGSRETKGNILRN